MKNFSMVSSINDLFDGFGIKARCINADTHRHFSFYDVELDRGTRISRLTRYSDELALAMRTKTSLIITPIPEKGIVRIHTTHRSPDILAFDDLYNLYPCPKDYILPFIFGETAEGNPLWVDMAKNPHLLVAGSTGSGKSSFLHTLIANASKRNDTKLVLIDTKRVEFNIYNDIFYKNLAYSISNDYDSVMSILNVVHSMMESRYSYMSKIGIQSIEQSPNLFDKIMVIVDEAADLMLYNKSKDFENLLVRLAQKARAAGIYLVVATQRPSVDVITGLIKSNFPARLACKVSTKTDSRVVLDQHGAENLAGRGDAIIKQPTSEAIRFQVAYVNPNEVVNVRRGECQKVA